MIVFASDRDEEEGDVHIGFVGLGQMGAAMSPHLAAGGYRVTGHDLNPPAQLAVGVAFVAEPNALRDCDVIITMLPDGDVVSRVVLDLVEKGCRALIIDMSSSHPDGSRDLAATLAATGLGYIDAPVSGGVSRAMAGDLMIMAGGAVDIIARAMPILSCMGRVSHLGEAGCGHAMKALNNYVSAAGLIASFQAVATARDFGIAPDRFLDVINHATGRNNTTEVKIDRFVLTDAFNSGFALALMEKDVTIAADLMRAAGHDGPVSAAVLDDLRSGLAMLGTKADHTELFRYLTRGDGVPSVPDS